MKKVIFLVVMFVNVGFAQTSNAVFETANNLYKEGKIDQAIENYAKIASQNLISSELFFNLGNCYYKLNKVGPAIYNYEKALKIDPLNEDAKNNLVFAKRLALDSIEVLPKTFLQRIDANYLQKLSYNQWAIVVVILSILGSLLFLLFYFSQTSSQKRMFFTTSIVSFLLLIITIFITYNQYKTSKNNVEAIIFTEKAIVMNAPTNNSEEIFTLHEGTKVFVLDAIDNWSKIKLADGKIGWMISGDLKEIKI